jgi:hypothetical protein
MPGLKGHGTVLNYRANAESARFSAALAAEMYGQEPHHGYGFGGSGGGHRSVRAAEYAWDVYDGVAPFMIPPPIYPQMGSVKALAAFRLRRKLDAVVDATAPGGSGDHFATLDGAEREALALVYRCGMSKGSEWLLPVMVAGGRAANSEYVEDFWSLPGYAGADWEVREDLLEAWGASPGWPAPPTCCQVARTTTSASSGCSG